MHAGGVIRDARIQKQNLAQLREVLAAKSVADRQLASISRLQAVKVDAAFSSLSALLGTAGQANYAAANMALNAASNFKQHQGKSPFPDTLSVGIETYIQGFSYSHVFVIQP